MESQNQLQIYNFQNCAIRTIEKDGELWWVAKDVCSLFNDSTPKRSLSRLDDDEKGVAHVSTPGGQQQMTIISEPGLYSLLFYMQPQKSNSQYSERVERRIEQLKASKRWVTHEVLPRIRRTGTYFPSAPSGESRGGQADEIAARLTLIEEEVKRLKLDRAAEQNAKRLPGDFPKQPPYIKIYYTRVCTAVSPELQEYIAERLPFEHGDRAKLYEEVRKKNDRPISQATFYRLCSTLENLLCTPEPVESTEGKA